jgi:hypothetical protein
MEVTRRDHGLDRMLAGQLRDHARKGCPCPAGAKIAEMRSEEDLAGNTGC